MDDSELRWGELPDGRLATVSEVERGEACGCVCPDCRRPFIAHQGTERAWYFRHKPEAGLPLGCAGYLETTLHKLAKQIIGEAGRLFLPGLTARHQHRREPVSAGQWVEISNVRTEVSLGRIKPDLIVTAGGRDLLVEVYVTHAAEPAKLAWLAERTQPAIEIDLSGARDRPLDEVGPFIIEKSPRHWLWHRRQAEIDAALTQRIEAQLERQRRAQEAEERAQAEERARYQAALERHAREYQEAREKAEAEAAEARRLFVAQQEENRLKREALMKQRAEEHEAAQARWNEEHAEEIAAAEAARVAHEAELEEQRQRSAEAKKAAYEATVAQWRKENRARMEGRIPLAKSIADAQADAQRRYERNKRDGIIR